MLLNIVTDEELFVSEVVKAILLLLIISGIIYNLLKIFRKGLFKRKIISLLLLFSLLVFAFFVGKEFYLEINLMRNAQYVQGTTIGFCNEFALGKGIKFEYTIQGKKYQNCNSFYPLSIDSITIPEGKYLVRYTLAFPDKGRMDFQKRIE